MYVNDGNYNMYCRHNTCLFSFIYIVLNQKKDTEQNVMQHSQNNKAR